MVVAYEQRYRVGGTSALQEAEKFFMREDQVHASLQRIVQRLELLGVAYCIVGGMALVAHGYNRTTVDVDLLVTPEDLKKIHESLDGLGYLPPFEGSKHLRDTQSGVRIEFLTTGGFPGDGKEKAVAFPNPKDVSVEISGVRYLKLPTLLELKLASGMTNVNRLKDLADVQELIRHVDIPRTMAEQLNPYVREKFLELWDALAAEPDEER